MNKFTKIKALTLGVLGFSFLICLSGYNATEDNPTSVDKMQDIRKKQDAERSKFNPTVTTPPGGAK